MGVVLMSSVTLTFALLAFAFSIKSLQVLKLACKSFVDVIWQTAMVRASRYFPSLAISLPKSCCLPRDKFLLLQNSSLFVQKIVLFWLNWKLKTGMIILESLWDRFIILKILLNEKVCSISQIKIERNVLIFRLVHHVGRDEQGGLGSIQDTWVWYQTQQEIKKDFKGIFTFLNVLFLWICVPVLVMTGGNVYNRPRSVNRRIICHFSLCQTYFFLMTK